MAGIPRLSRRARWAVPAGALVITGGVIAGSVISVAQAAPGLPARTAAQLLADAADSVTPPLTGTVVETASFGLPALPATGNPTSVSSLLTGSNTIRVWYASPDHFRLAVPQSLSESDVIRDGSTAWLWQSTLNQVTKFTLPAHSAASQPAVPKQPLTPQQAAQQVLAAVGPTTTVSVASNVTVAGQAAYGLVLAPKDARSLVGQIQIDIDGSNGVPLRLQVFARGASSPAFQVGYTDIHFVTPASADLSFTPPPGAKVTQVNMASGDRGSHGQCQLRGFDDRVRLADRPQAAVLRAGPGRADPRLLGPSGRQRRGQRRRAARPACLGHPGARRLGQRPAAADQPGLGADDRPGQHVRRRGRAQRPVRGRVRSAVAGTL